MKSLKLAIVALLAVANAPAAEPFAIVCEGTANFSHRGLARKSMPTGKQVFVIDIEQRSVTRALEPRQVFDPICGADGVKIKADVSPGIINAWQFNRTADGSSETCSFELDRRNGHAKYELSLESQNRVLDGFRWEMNCERTEIPVFNTNGNKF